MSVSNASFKDLSVLLVLKASLQIKLGRGHFDTQLHLIGLHFSQKPQDLGVQLQEQIYSFHFFGAVQFVTFSQAQ